MAKRRPRGKSAENLLKQIELHLNTISADQDVFGTTLQVLLLNTIGKTAAKHVMFGAIRDQVLGSIDLRMPSKDDPQGGERHKQLTRMRAEAFFQALGEALGVPSDKPPPAS